LSYFVKVINKYKLDVGKHAEIIHAMLFL